MLNGTAYGIILNDRNERKALEGAFTVEPYRKPPIAPVLYIKPRTCVVPSGASVLVPQGTEVSVAATVALLFGRDTAQATHNNALEGVSGMCLAFDVAEPHANYFRPAIRERCRDGFLPLGTAVAFARDIRNASIITSVDGREVHRWSLSQLVRGLEELIVDVTAFMTFSAGDVLLVGLPGNPPRIHAGQHVKANCAGFPPLYANFLAEVAP